MDLYVQYGKGSIWKSTELAEKAISAPNRQGLPQKDVKGNINSTDKTIKDILWHKQLMWNPPARHVNREGKRVACEKHMDWWTASTKPFLQPYAIENCSTIALTEERLQMSLAARFLTRDVAQIVELSLCMREVRGSMPPASPIFQRSPEIKKRKYGKLFCWTKRRHGFVRPICEKKSI